MELISGVDSVSLSKRSLTMERRYKRQRNLGRQDHSFRFLYLIYTMYCILIFPFLSLSARFVLYIRSNQSINQNKSFGQTSPDQSKASNVVFPFACYQSPGFNQTNLVLFLMPLAGLLVPASQYVGFQGLREVCC